MGTIVAIDDIKEALELAADEMSSYVNQRTGEVRMVSHENLRLAEDEPGSDLPDWQQQAIAEAKQVLETNEWLELPSKFDIHEWEIMDRFAASQSNESTQRELQGAIRGSGAFRSFKSAIRRLGIEDAWFRYKTGALEEIAREWLSGHGFSVDDGRPTRRCS